METLPLRRFAALALLVTALAGPAPSFAGPPPDAAAGPGDRLTARADDFVVRWGRAVNRRDWAWVRDHSGAGVRRHLDELEELRASTRLPLTRNCEWMAGMPRRERLCSLGHVLEVSPVRTADGTLRMRSFAIYR